MIRTNFHPKSGIIVFEDESTYTYSKAKNRGFKSYIETRTNKTERLYRTAAGKWIKQVIRIKSNRSVRNKEKGEWKNPFNVELESENIFGDDIYYYLDEDTKRYFTAIHEAGHFLADIHEGRRPKYITVIPKDNTRGHMRIGRRLSKSEWRNLSRKAYQSRIFTGMAGAVAENAVSKRFSSASDALKYSVGAYSDVMQINQIIYFSDPNSHEEEFQTVLKRTEKWVENNIEKIKEVAQQLFERGKITLPEYHNLKKAS